MTGNFVFEEGLLGPAFSMYNGHISVAEQPMVAPLDTGQERVIKCAQPCNCHFSVTIDNAFWMMFCNAPDLCHFEVQMLFEGMGTHAEFDEPVAPIYVPYVAAPAPHVVTHNWAIPAYALPEGVYRVVATVKLVRWNGAVVLQKLPAVAFADLGFMEVYVTP